MGPLATDSPQQVSLLLKVLTVGSSCKSHFPTERSHGELPDEVSFLSASWNGSELSGVPRSALRGAGRVRRAGSHRCRCRGKSTSGYSGKMADSFLFVLVILLLLCPQRNIFHGLSLLPQKLYKTRFPEKQIVRFKPRVVRAVVPPEQHRVAVPLL